ncbi:MAG: riboflavin biosynthesis protein RibF [Lachnospiraceae bacterium]|nr:riboflavin biosynthesis protein RibF [Lachnospiraceae bacterium]
MQFIAGRTHFKLGEKSAVAIGKFDGIHRGHKRLLQEILACKSQGLLAVVFTFDPPAASFFSGKTVQELTTREEKRRRFAAMGVDVLVEFPLNTTTAAMPAEQFVKEILSESLNTRFIAAGTDLSFGAGGAGNAALLHRLSGRYGYRVGIIDKICENGREISSTYLREEVEKGNMEMAARLLGEPYRITGEVVHGRKLGRSIGMPTVNQLPEKEKLLPPNGVYYAQVRFGGRLLNGITNIGYKPTVSRERVIGAETYLYDFSEEIYGQQVEVDLLHYKRPEMRFEGVEQLKSQMQKDIAEGRSYFLEKMRKN